MLRAPHLTALIAGLAGAGCGDKSAVALSASIDRPSVRVEEVTLGTRLSGGFDLLLELGPSASAATTVSLGAFGLVRAADHATVVQPLPLHSDLELPVSVGIGKSVTVRLDIDDEKLRSAAERASLCAEPLLLQGTVTDTLSDGAVTNVGSRALSAEGC